MNRSRYALLLAVALTAGTLPPAAAFAATPDQLLAGYNAQTGAPPSAARGQQFFNATHGKEWTCASCHGSKPVQAGKHATTGKTIIQQECTSCHLAYPYGMLPSASWQGIMNNLQRHYGTDASLDAATARELSSWLTANSGTYRRVREQPPEDRITRSDWFIREHRKVPPETWRFPAVKAPANCTACHTQADQGDFNERNIRIPR